MSNLAILKAFLQQFQSGDWEGACDQYVSDEMEIHEPPGIPQQGIYKGRYAPIEVSNIYRAIWHFDIGEQQLWDQGDIVFSRYVLTWKNKATGKAITQPVVELNHFSDKKLIKMEVFMFNPIGLVATLAP